MGSISYYAIGAELSEDYHERTRVTATRSALAVVGVLIAAASPQLLSDRHGEAQAIPPSILADIVDGDARTQSSRPDGAYFGVWQMVDKLNLALAAGIAFPLRG